MWRKLSSSSTTSTRLSAPAEDPKAARAEGRWGLACTSVIPAYVGSTEWLTRQIPPRCPTVERLADDFVAAGFFGFVEVVVRDLDERLGRDLVHRAADADRHRDVDVVALEVERLRAHQLAHVLADLERLLAAGLRQRDGELLAAVAREHLFFAHARAD